MRQRSPAAVAVLCALVLICAVGVFLPAWKFQFVSWDDRDLVMENPLLAQPTLSHLRQFWTAPYAGLYTPLSYTLWWSLAWISGGIDAGAFHALNVALHAGAAMLVFAILRILVRNDLAAFLGAMLFALHPLQVEPVAWISGMNNLLAGLLSLAAICLALHFSPSKWAWFTVATVVFILAILAKPTAVAVPLIVLIVILIPMSQLPGRARIQQRALMISWLCIAAIFAILAHAQQPAPPSPLSHRPVIALDAIAFYLGKLLWPAHLTVDYARTPQSLWRGNLWISTALIPLLLAAALWLARRRTTGLAAGLGIMVAALLPVLGLVPFDFQRYSTVADRYMYLAMLGPALALAWLAARSKTLVTIALICVVLLGWRTEMQLRHWRDTASLVDYTLTLDPLSTIGNKVRAAELARQGNFAEALPYYRVAMVRNPADGDLHFNCANALRALGDYRQAMAEYEAAIPLLGGDLRLRAINNLDIARRQLNALNVPSR